MGEYWVDFPVVVRCKQCGRELMLTARWEHPHLVVTVDLCPDCLEQRWHKGYQAAVSDTGITMKGEADEIESAFGTVLGNGCPIHTGPDADTGAADAAPDIDCYAGPYDDDDTDGAVDDTYCYAGPYDDAEYDRGGPD